MAFLRFTRDKRGYEHFYLVEATPTRKGKLRSRLLYWFRTPPNVKVGRQPFDDNVRRLLETHNPGVVFDWRAITETPIPSADAERWREKRRAERAARIGRAEEERAEIEEVEAAEQRIEESAIANAPDTVTISPEPIAISEEPAVAAAPAPADSDAPQTASGAGDAARRKRRRRRGRRGRPRDESPARAVDSHGATTSGAEALHAADDSDDSADEDDQDPSPQ